MVNTNYVMFLIASKVDLSEDEQVSIKEAGDYARKIGAELY